MPSNELSEIYLSTDVFSNWVKDKYFVDKDIITLDDLLTKFEDTLDDLERTQEEYNNFKKDVEDNYKPLTTAEQIGWDENW